MVYMPALVRPPTKQEIQTAAEQQHHKDGLNLQKLAAAAAAATSAFHDEIRYLRIEQMWSLRDLAKYAGLSHTTIKNICGPDRRSG